MGWFEENGYETGGVTGGGQDLSQVQGPMSPEGPQNLAQQAAAAQAAAFNPGQQVGHDGTINGLNREQYRDAWQASGARSMADLQKFTAEHGGTIQSGNGTALTPFGESLDMLQGARTNGNGSAAWGGVGGGGPQGGGGNLDGDMRFSPGGGGFDMQRGGGGGYTGGPGSAAGPGGVAGGWDGVMYQNRPDFTPDKLAQQDIARPGAYQNERFTAPDAFKAPTEADMLQDPSYKFRLNESLGAMQNSAAAKGLLRSGGTFSALSDRAGEAASQEYGAVYGRKSSEYDRAFGNAFSTNQLNNQTGAQAYDLTNRYQQNSDIANQQNRFNVGQANISNAAGAHAMNAQNSLAGWQANVGAQLNQGNLTLGNKQADNSYSLGQANVGLGYANNALGYHSANQSYDLGLRNNALGYTQAGNQMSIANGQLGLGYANYGLNRDTQNFNQGFSLADLGLRAAGQQGNYAGAYGQNSANNQTGIGNVQGAGTVGAANAWNQGIGGAVDTGVAMYGAYQNQQNGYRI